MKSSQIYVITYIDCGVISFQEAYRTKRKADRRFSELCKELHLPENNPSSEECDLFMEKVKLVEG